MATPEETDKAFDRITIEDAPDGSKYSRVIKIRTDDPNGFDVRRLELTDAEKVALYDHLSREVLGL